MLGDERRWRNLNHAEDDPHTIFRNVMNLREAQPKILLKSIRTASSVVSPHAARDFKGDIPTAVGTLVFCVMLFWAVVSRTSKHVKFICSTFSKWVETTIMTHNMIKAQIQGHILSSH